MRIKCYQNDDDSWFIEIPLPNSAMVSVMPLGKLSKEQVGQELLRRGYEGAVLIDKEVCKALREGRVTNKDILDECE